MTTQLLYGVQIRWPEGDWTYVMRPWSMEVRQLFRKREWAEEFADTWRRPGHEDAVRVVEVEV